VPPAPIKVARIKEAGPVAVRAGPEVEQWSQSGEAFAGHLDGVEAVIGVSLIRQRPDTPIWEVPHRILAVPQPRFTRASRWGKGCQSWWNTSGIIAHHSPSSRVSNGSWQGEHSAHHSRVFESAAIRAMSAAKSAP
jgi:hypothetical protein